MDQTLNKQEKLKSKKEIERLFVEGKSIKDYPLRMVYIKQDHSNSSQVGFSVSKRNFKNAVERNRVKRLLREAYRKNKYIVEKNTSHHYKLMFLYLGKNLPNQSIIYVKIKGLLEKLT